MMFHITEIQGQGSRAILNDVFSNVNSGNTILLLGAGASITEHNNYLSSELMDLHKAETGSNYETDNIIDYVDVLSKNPGFDRTKFDDLVERCLRNLEPDEFHTTIARLPWKEIITTNMDTVLEKAFDRTRGTSDENKILKVARTTSEFRYNPAVDEIKYVKLNGCISDRSKYPFVFSSKDFETVRQFYKIVLQTVENMSPRIQFLVIGYSFGDPFAKQLLDRFDSSSFRNKKEITLVEPTVQEAMLPYLESNNIRVVNCTTSEFMHEYEEWEKSNEELTQRKTSQRFRKSDNSPINLPHRVTNRLGNNLSQLHSDFRYDFITPDRFYAGERPSFFVIKQNYDVIRSDCQQRVIKELESVFSSEESIVPIVALTGSYGVGKTTFCYRLADSILNSDLDVAVFEVLRPQDIREVDLRELISVIDTENVILLFDECEVDSFFKAMIELRSSLNIQQLSGPNIVMLVPIRENILQKLTNNLTYPHLYKLEIDATFNTTEAADLISKLEDSKIVEIRDEIKRQDLVSKVVKEYRGDPFVSLLSMVTNGHHDSILRSAYLQLSVKARESFLYTSLLYRFKILMPSSLLMRLVSKDWSEFKRDVIEYDAKGILVQEERNVSGDDPDLYFRTRHPVISDLLVKMYLGASDTRFSQYQTILRRITYTPHSSRLVVDILKAIRITEEFTPAKINQLYDSCANEFSFDPHFNLHYAINLQYRGSQKDLERGIERIIQAEGYLDRRNNRLTHRRAVLNHRLATVLYEQHISTSVIQPYVDEARELFKIKLIEDPYSEYSFREYLRFEVWCLKVLSFDTASRMRSMVVIEDLLYQAKSQLKEGIETIASIEADYRRVSGSESNNEMEYRNHIDDLYKNPDAKPYALIL
ncbi:MAG: hypothetical protein F4Z14_03795, partial [Gammaproteobacteria bacterium]|nr:hypothetical protein [Gammaproteobacteria bacterium]